METPVRGNLFETDNIWSILLKIAPPVMLAQLIQALYNIVDSFFVGQFSEEGLTALSVIYPIQYLIVAVAVGTGVGVNTKMARCYAQKDIERADRTAGTGSLLALFSWAVFAVLSVLLMRPYVITSANSEIVVNYAVVYGTIVCACSLGIFMESTWSKVHQAGGNMRLPMIAQIAGALTNIVLDPILIFGLGPVPALDIAGAAWATVMGQFVAAAITITGFRIPPGHTELAHYARSIYRLGYPSILTQALYTVYIVVLNVILAGFCDEAVTVLGLYYKLQSFFFIPLLGLQTCIVPLLSYAYAQGAYKRCRRIMTDAILLTLLFMLLGMSVFELIPRQLLGLFSSSNTVFKIGETALRTIGPSFIPASLSLLFPTFFQAIGAAKASAMLSVTRQIFCLIPLFWLFSRLGLGYSWLAFPASELISGGVGTLLYCRQLHQWHLYIRESPQHIREGGYAMKLITAIVNSKDTAEVCRALTEAGYYFTRMTSAGGFLSVGSTTLMIGTTEEKINAAIDVIRVHCSRRLEMVPTNMQNAASSVSYPSQVTVGGATIFVTPVEQFEKL